MLKLALTVIAIALPDCINPTLIGGELFVATGSHPRRRTAVFTLAALTVTFLFGFAIALGLGDLILSLVPKPGATVNVRADHRSWAVPRSRGDRRLDPAVTRAGARPSGSILSATPTGRLDYSGAGIGGL